MQRSQVEEVLGRSEAALDSGADVDLAALGFWKAVSAIKRDPTLVEEFGSRVATIDRLAFERWALLKVPAAVGTILMGVGTVIGLVLIGLAYRYTGLGQALLLLIGTGVLLVTTHGLTHFIVGTAQGMSFTHWFLGSMTRPQPGVKVDYASYLRAPAQQRAWMHASGAIVTKIVPLVGLGAGLAMRADSWVLWLLAVLTVVQVVTDIAWSTKSSDWKKFRREMKLR
jgi:hypothetical protein